MGFHGIFKYDNKVYLPSCINRTGESTFTDAQYTHNQNVQRTLLWLIGYKDLFEKACLWTLISSPVASNLDSAALAKAY